MYHRPGHQSLIPPPNFAIVETNVYRSAYPTLASVPYLKHIGIKTIVLLSIEVLPGPVVRLLTSPEKEKKDSSIVNKNNAAPHIRIVCAANLTSWMNEYSWTQDDFAVSDVQHALDFALDTDFQPVLFACPTGEVQTSVVVGCMRRHQGWTVSAALAESDLFVDITREVRASVMSFIERWDPRDHPVRESDIVLRKRELLMRERQNDLCQRLWRRGDANASAATDTDSDEDDAVLSVHIAQWYTSALARRSALAAAIAAARERRATGAAALEPHERFLGVLNPPALDGRSSFTKESIVEEDDD